MKEKHIIIYSALSVIAVSMIFFISTTFPSPNAANKPDPGSAWFANEFANSVVLTIPEVAADRVPDSYIVAMTVSGGINSIAAGSHKGKIVLEDLKPPSFIVPRRFQ